MVFVQKPALILSMAILGKRSRSTGRSTRNTAYRVGLYKRAAGGEPRRVPRNTLGSLGGSKVPASKTTLARCAGPFQGKKYVNFLYENGMQKLAGAATFTPVQIRCNAAYGVDAGGYLGNKQPLYYDQLVDAAGPYTYSKVISWKTTWTIVNQTTVPINIFVHGAHALADFNSVVEAENFPGVKRLYLTNKDGSKNHGTVVVTGNIADLATDQGKDWRAYYNAYPAAIVGGTCLVQCADGVTTTADVYVSIKHEMYTELQTVDGQVS